MNFLKRKRVPVEPEPIQKPKQEKSCRRIIKRDKEGRVKEESYVGCSPQEIKMMRENQEE